MLELSCCRNLSKASGRNGIRGVVADTITAPPEYEVALASTNAMVRRLGAKRWLVLHRLVYAIATLGVIHFLWLVKKDIREPVAFGVVLAILLGVRVLYAVRKRMPTTSSRAHPT